MYDLTVEKFYYLYFRNYILVNRWKQKFISHISLESDD